jgi:hypothetical protein
VATRDERTGHLLPGRFIIVTSAVSLARELWRYGESDLSRRACELSPAEVADVGVRAAEMADAGEPERVWPAGPGFAKGALVLAVVEMLDGTARPPQRNRRLPEQRLPASLQLTEAERWEANKPVRAELDSRR